MATQKTQGIEELKVFNEKAKEVSQYVEVRVRKILKMPKWQFSASTTYFDFFNSD